MQLKFIQSAMFFLFKSNILAWLETVGDVKDQPFCECLRWRQFSQAAVNVCKTSVANRFPATIKVYILILFLSLINCYRIRFIRPSSSKLINRIQTTRFSASVFCLFFDARKCVRICEPVSETTFLMRSSVSVARFELNFFLKLILTKCNLK